MWVSGGPGRCCRCRRSVTGLAAGLTDHDLAGGERRLLLDAGLRPAGGGSVTWLGEPVLAPE
jgi:hypothetical protein